MKTLLASALLVGMIVSANAATIKYEGTQDGLNAVSITGDVLPGDFNKFAAITNQLAGPTVVLLNSPGGNVVEGLSIGTAIRRNDYRTAVVNDDICASICGMIWLAGSPRYRTANSSIGFHAAFRNSDGQESGQANALIGAYLARLGLSYPAVLYVTEAPPDGINWLTPSDAARVGIIYSLLEPEPRIQSAPYQPTPPAPIGTPAEQQARRLVLTYHAYWSQGGPNVEGLAAYYADTVSFYGSMLLRDKVMDEKRKFSIRWPIRHYSIDPNSLFVQCDGSACSVTGVVAWDCANLERGAHSIGTANFALRIVDGVIVSENGSVLTRDNNIVEQEADTSTPAYAQGRQARIDYERWYSSLSEGSSYKDGANFWATHRSDKPAPPNCVGTPEWVAGCVSARIKLTPSDLRRNSDSNFRSGWNGL